jgi:phosphoglycerate kinase
MRILAAIVKLTTTSASGELTLPKIDTAGNAPLSTSVLSSKQDLDDVKIWTDKRVLVRVDYNVPIENGVVGDRSRISETIPTIRKILDPKQGGVPKCITLICHWGRPAGNFNREKNTLRPCVQVLQDLLPDVPIVFVDDCVGPMVKDAQNNCKPGTVILCENLRFHPEEAGEDVDADGKKFKLPKEQCDKFAAQLSELGDVFVFEAFGVSHRKAASVTGITTPVRVAGLLMQKELQFYSKVLDNPKRPFLAIVGGAKVSDKIQVIENLLSQCDEIIIGGGMAYTFLKVLNGKCLHPNTPAIPSHP